jgi:predicted transcriptional regulator
MSNNDNKKYIEPKKHDIELVLSKEKKQICREIVAEINRFGVSQRQKIFICELLALELEDQEVSKAFTEAVKVSRSKLGNEIINETQIKKKLIV